jgi:hypothetical protein
VIAQINSIDAHLCRLDGIFDRLHPLETDGHLGVLAQPRNVVPIELWIDKAADGPADTAAFGILGNLAS